MMKRSYSCIAFTISFFVVSASLLASEAPKSALLLNPLDYGIEESAKELVSRRTLHTATFHLGGNKMVQVSVPNTLFTKDDNGNIVLASLASYKTQDSIVYDRLPQGVTIEFSRTTPSYTYSRDGESFTFAFEGEAVADQVSQNAVAYKLSENTRLVWTLDGAHVRKEIFVRNNGEIANTPFSVRSDTLEKQELPSGALRLLTEEKEEFITIEAPFLQTIHREDIEEDVSLSHIVDIDAYQFQYNPNGLPVDYIIDPSTTETGSRATTVARSGNANTWDVVVATDMQTNDDTYTPSQTAGVDGTLEYLKVQDFRFNIPNDATVTGIELSLSRYADSDGVDAGYAVDDHVLLISSSDSIIQDDATDDAETGSSENQSAGATWPATEAITTFGGDGNNWDSPWSPSDINDTDFGVALSPNMVAGTLSFTAPTIYIDHLTLKVYYTEGCNGDEELCPSGDANITVSGTVYSDKGITDVGAGKSVKIAIDGVVQNTDTTDSNGEFQFIDVGYSADEIVTIFVDGDSNNAVRILETPRSNNSGIDLYYSYLIIEDDSDGSMTTTDLGTGEVNDTDVTDVFDVTGNNIVMGSSTILLVSTGSYVPNGTVDAVSIDIETNGGLDLTSASTFTVSGDFTRQTGGTFTHANKTVTFDGSVQTLSGAVTFHTLTHATAGSTLTVAGGTHVVANTLNLTGTTGNKIVLNKANTGKLQLTSGGTDNVSYVNPTGIDSSGGETIACSGCTDGGSNTNWTFGGCTISNIQSGRSATLSDDSTDLSSSEEFGSKTVYLKHGSNRAAEFTYDFDAGDCNFSGVIAERSDYQTIVHNLDLETGVTTATMKMYVKRLSHHTTLSYYDSADDTGDFTEGNLSFTSDTEGNLTAYNSFNTTGYSVATGSLGADLVWIVTGPIGSGGESGGSDVPDLSWWAVLFVLLGCGYVLHNRGMLEI